MLTPRRILHPTDFSDHSDTALDAACSIARGTDAEVMILHVVSPPASHGEVVARRQDDGFWDEMRDRLHQVRPKDPAIQVSYLLEEGRPAIVILDTARAYGCDLIVLGTYGRTGVCRALMGSVAEQVSRRATCPVLTVKAATPVPPTDAPAAGEVLGAAL
ncbi:MAG: universal stress protein [Zavarzinella sp.]|nr:universal stress protein [Zavarzinella sp.]